MTDLVACFGNAQELYLHGTNSLTLWLLQYTKLQLIGPIKMMMDLLIAPLTGELDNGISGATDCCTCFGTLIELGRYNLDHIMKNYAETNRFSYEVDQSLSISLIKTHTIQKLDNYLEFDKKPIGRFGFGSINKRLLTIMRASMLNIDLNSYTYLQNHIENIVKLYRVFTIIYKSITINQGNLRTAFPNLKHNSSINDIFVYFRWNEPTVGDLFSQILQQLFSKINTHNFSDLNTTIVLQLLNSEAQMITKKPNLVIFEQNDNSCTNDIETAFTQAFTENETFHWLFQQVFSVNEMELYKTPVAGIEKERLAQRIETHIENLHLKSLSIAKIYTHTVPSASPLHTIKRHLAGNELHPLVANPFPIIFVCADANKLTACYFSYGLEYRAETAEHQPNILQLGTDIPIVATATENIEKTQQFLSSINLPNVQVVDFIRLQKIKQLVYQYVTSKETTKQLHFSSPCYTSFLPWKERLGNGNIANILTTTVQCFFKAKTSSNLLQEKRQLKATPV